MVMVLNATHLIILGIAVVSTVILWLYIRASASPAPSPMMIRNKIETGLLHEQRQEWHEASLALESALKMLQESPEPNLDQEVTCYVHLGNAYERLGEPDKAGRVFQQAVDNWKLLLQQKKLNPIDIDYAMTNLDFGRGTLTVAEFYVDNIITMRERTFPPGSEDLKNSYKIGAGLLRRSGYHAEAQLLEKRGIEGPPPA